MKAQLIQMTAERDQLIGCWTEIDRLKAELQRVICPHGDGGWCEKDLIAYKQDRDGWKSRAERLAEVLKNKSHEPECYLPDTKVGSYQMQCQRGLDEVLIDFPSPSTSGVRDEGGSS